jgi:hypothetical protein
MNTLLIILAVALVIWIGGTLFAVRWIEEPSYTLVEKREGYEIRDYASYVVAEVEVEGDMHEALRSGFRQLAGYIFGGNTTQSSIAMTAPVMDTAKLSENISMTVPVMDTLSNSGKHIVAFTMPSAYTLESLPKPDNANVRFRVVEKTKRAVLRYSWYATETRVDVKKKSLIELLTRDGYTMKWDIVSAQYNPPLSFPLLRRNEVMVDIE